MRNRRISFLVGLSASLGLIQSLLALFWGASPLPRPPWFLPAIEVFCLGGGLSVTFLCVGRYLFRREPYALWLGSAFWLSSLLNLFYVISAQGILPGIQNAPAYLFYLMYLCLVLPSLLPSSIPHRDWSLRARPTIVMAWTSVLCLAVTAVLFLSDDRLPSLTAEGSAHPLASSAPYLFFFLYLAGTYNHWRRFRRAEEAFMGYFLAFLVVSLWVFPGMILFQKGVGISWYSYHLTRAFGYMAVYVSLLLEYFSLYRELDGALNRMALIHRLSAEVSGSLDLQEIFQTLSHDVRKLVSYDRLAVNLLQKNQHYVWVYSEESGLPSRAVPEAVSRIEGTASGWVIDHREPLVCEDVLEDDRFPLTVERYKKVGLRSFMILPLIAKGQVVGVLNLGSMEPRRYSRRDIDLAAPLAEILSLAVENSELYHESQRRERMQKLLKELTQDIASLDVSTLLARLTRQVPELLEADACDVRLQEGGRWVIKAAFGIDLSVYSADSAAETPSGAYGTGWIVKHRQPLQIPDILAPEGVAAGERVKKMGFRGYLGVPIFARNSEVIGTLRVLTRQPKEFGQDEVELLKQCASGAAIALENAKALRERQNLFETIPDIIYVLDLEGNLVDWNKRAEVVTGLTKEEMYGWPVMVFFPQDERARVESAIRETFEKGRLDIEAHLRTKAGSQIPYHWIGSPLKDDQGKVIGLTGAGRDISERKAAEATLQQMNAQLEAANKELEAFSYSVSHDLRTPLRGLDGFSQALLEDYSARMDTRGQHYLQRIRAASQRMAQLIDDLLNLSRMSRAEIRRESVNLSALAKIIAEDLRQREPERSVMFVIPEGLIAEGDGRLLRVVLVNLIENAWKFTSRTANARIEFGLTATDGRHAYFVRDNGAGFDMTYAHKLFGAFQRLHSETEFKGTGIGLATAQRIIHRHGGRIWAEAEVEKGAAFYFTL